MISIGLKTYKLLRYHCGCHGKPVTIATRYVADTYHTKKTSYQILTQQNSRQKSYLHSTVVVMVTKLP